MASKLAKYSGLLEPHQENILNRFIQDHNISKAKVIGLLLENWEKENYPKYQDSDRPVKFSELNELVNSLLDERLKSFNINNPNLVNNLVSSKENEVSNNFSNQVSNDTEVSNKVSSEVSSEISNEVKNEVMNLDKNQFTLFEDKEAIGNDENIGEEVLETVETLPDMGLTIIGEGNIEVIPSENELEEEENLEGTFTTENKNDEVKGESEGAFFSYEDAKKEIVRLFGEGQNPTAISKVLNGKYLTKTGKSSKWQNTQVERILIELNLKTPNQS